MKKLLNLLAGAALAVTAVSAAAQSWPTRPVKIIVPFTAGGLADVLARQLGDELGRVWKQPVVVENRPGAGTMIAGEATAKSAPDGYTLLLSDVSVLTIAPRLYPKLGYTAEQLAPVVNVASFAHILIASPNSTLKSFGDVLSQEKAKPGRFNSASSGNGTSTHLTIEMVNVAASTQIKHVPYKGGGAALTDVMSGQVDMMFIGAPPAMPLIRSGKLKALAVTTSSRMSTLPQVPTLAEAGLPKFESVAAQGIFAPAGTPREIINKINAEVIRIIRMPDVRARWDVIGAEPVDDTPQQFSSWVALELDKWGKVIQSSGAKPD